MLATPWVFVHPADADRTGVADGDPVRLANGRGAVDLVAKVSDRTQPGVLVSYMVRWGPNANATTPDDIADMGGNSTYHSNFVRLERLSSGDRAS
jgi:anaerobic selenocysteine-containing dehydrogenase